MSLYAINVFLHVVGALGLFAALSLEWAGLRGMRQAASVEHARQWIGLLGSLGRLAGVSALILLATGLYMSATAWQRQSWIRLGLVGWIFIGAIGPGLTGRRIRAISRGLPPHDGSLSGPLLRRMRDPVLLLSAWLRTALALGIVFLMTTKPGAAMSLAAVVLSVAIGAGAGLPAWLSRLAPAGIVGGGIRELGLLAGLPLLHLTEQLQRGGDQPRESGIAGVGGELDQDFVNLGDAELAVLDGRLDLNEPGPLLSHGGDRAQQEQPAVSNRELASRPYLGEELFEHHVTEGHHSLGRDGDVAGIDLLHHLDAAVSALAHGALLPFADIVSIPGTRRQTIAPKVPAKEIGACLLCRTPLDSEVGARSSLSVSASTVKSWPAARTGPECFSLSGQLTVFLGYSWTSARRLAFGREEDEDPLELARPRMDYDLIFETAERLFAARGCDDATMPDLASEAGVSPRPFTQPSPGGREGGLRGRCCCHPRRKPTG
jgi:hypothetical protein